MFLQSGARGSLVGLVLDDAELLELIGEGRITESRVGSYLDELRDRFQPTIVADMLCLVRLRAELSIRAKGVLLAREAGFNLPPDPEIEDRLTERELVEEGFEPGFIQTVAHRIALNQYKRLPPIIAKLGNRTINHDFRYLRSWGH